MSNTLRELLFERADRADSTPATDPFAVVTLVRERVERRHRVRRNAAAAGGGAVLVAALVVGAVVLPSDHHASSAPAGGPGASTAPAPGSAVATHSPTPAATWSPAASAESRAVSAARSAASRAASVPTSPTRALVSATTPKAAAVAIGLVPEGWRYTGKYGPITYYGPDSMQPIDTPDNYKVIVVDVHQRMLPDGPNALTIGARKGRYAVQDGVQVISVIVDAATEMDIQFPISARLTKAQALRTAATLDLRSKAQTTKG